MEYRIGDAAKQVGLSIDTLRYYEKEGLLPRVRRSPSGTRYYAETDLACLRFIQRSQRMGFSLKEIRELLSLRANPAQACADTRDLTQKKLQEIQARIEELQQLSMELDQLMQRCGDMDDHCPIISGLDHTRPAANPIKSGKNTGRAPELDGRRR